MTKRPPIEIKHPGRLHERLGVAKDKPIPQGKLDKAKASSDP